MNMNVNNKINIVFRQILRPHGAHKGPLSEHHHPAHGAVQGVCRVDQRQLPASVHSTGGLH